MSTGTSLFSIAVFILSLRGRAGVYFLQKSTKKKLLFAKRGATAVARGMITLFTDKKRGKKILSLTMETMVALLSDQKRGKSHQRKAPRPPLQTTPHPVELAARSNARQVCAIYSKSKKF